MATAKYAVPASRTCSGARITVALIRRYARPVTRVAELTTDRFHHDNKVLN
ncbi:hypothetical protein [Streptomyces mirabilis]|uniref:hypothetical protein n=1 Tax=Streptomyces mirabilis TaxID=68239 RepID=UPI00365A5B94